MAAAKEEMLSGFGPLCADLPLAASFELSENSRLGFASKNAALHLGHEVCNSTTALGIERGLLGKCIGSRIQTWNRYAYVLNNPLSYVDPTGLDCAYLNDSGTGVDENGIDHNSNQGECWSNGGYWADGYIGGNSWVQTFSNSDNVIIDSSVNGFLGQTLAGSLNNGGTAFSQMFGLNASVDTILSNPFTPTNYVDPMAPSARQMLRAIAAAAPTVCGGGVFAYGGRSLDVGPANGFAGGIIEADSVSGISKGALFEAGGGEGIMGGGGVIVANNGGGLLGSENLAYGGAGVGIPGAHVGGGVVGFTGGIGGYGEISAGGREVGVGAYLNITNNAGCKQR